MNYRSYSATALLAEQGQLVIAFCTYELFFISKRMELLTKLKQAKSS
jgi:hypothetical protein